MRRRCFPCFWPASPLPNAIAPAPGASPASRSPRSFPLRNWRHGGENAFDIAAGAQAEMGAAIVKQVEFDITAAPFGLFVAFFFGPGFAHAAADDLRLDVEKGFAHAFGESEIPLPLAAVVMVVKNTANAARLTAMGQPEIGVGPFLIFGKPFLVEAVTGLL